MSRYVVSPNTLLIDTDPKSPSYGKLTREGFLILQNVTDLANDPSADLTLTGPITSVGTATSIASKTGTGTKFVVDTSPTLVTPGLGVATATTINKVSITAPAANAVLTIPNGVTLTGPAASGTVVTLENSETLTGKKTWTSGGVALTGTPPMSATFTGSGGSANFWLNQSGAAASATVPEIGAQFTLTSNVGTANKATAYKIGLTSSVIGAANSADIYGANIITQGFAGTGGYLVTGIESDINNVGAAAGGLATTTASYGMVSVAAGTFNSTAGFWATSNTVAWTYGFAVSNTSGSAAATADFYGGSNATDVLLSDTAHTFGVNFFSATFSGGYSFIAANNTSIGSANAAGNATYNIAELDSSDIIQYGQTTGVKGHIFRGNPGNSNEILRVQNLHATSGDVGMTLLVGSDVNTDTSTMMYFTSYNIGHIVGSISRNSGAFTVAYNTSSDERLKENITDHDGWLNTLMLMQPRQYNWREDPTGRLDYGFIAQELNEVFPRAVTPGGDDPLTKPWQVDKSALVPVLVGAIQELVARIEHLEKLSADRAIIS